MYRKFLLILNWDVVLFGLFWDFFVNSEFYKNYCDRNLFIGILIEGLDERLEVYLFFLIREYFYSFEGFFYVKFLIECLDILYVVYENFKLINFRKR